MRFSLLALAFVGLLVSMLYAKEQPADSPVVVKRHTIGEHTLRLELRQDGGHPIELAGVNESDRPLRLYWGGEAGDFGVACSYGVPEIVDAPVRVERDNEGIAGVQAPLSASA